MDATFSALRSSVLSVGKILVTCAIGALWARYLAQNKGTFRDVSTLITHALIPAMIFEKLVMSLDVDEVIEKTYLLPLVSLCFIGVGFVVGVFLSFFTPKHNRPLVVCSAMFPNAVGMALPIVGSLNNSVDWLREDPGSMETSVAYLFMINVVYSGLMWSLGYHITSKMAAPEDTSTQMYTVVTGPNRRPVNVPPPPGKNPDGASVRRRSFSGSGLESVHGDDHCDPGSSAAAHLSGQEEDDHDAPAPLSPRPEAHRRSCCGADFCKSQLLILRNLATPPFLATLCGIAVGLSPVKGIFVDIDDMGINVAPLTFVMDLLRFINEAAIPMVTLLLGSSMSNGPAGSLEKSTIVWAIIARLVVTPALSFALLHGLFVMGVLPPDRILLLCLMIVASNPSAMNLGVICSMHGRGQHEMVTITFYMYLCAVPMVTIWNTIILRYVTWVV